MRFVISTDATHAKLVIPTGVELTKFVIPTGAVARSVTAKWRDLLSCPAP